jgi:hypothetical protein
MIVVIICIMITGKDIVSASIIDGGSVSGVSTFIDSITGIQWANVSTGNNLSPSQMLSQLPEGFHLASLHSVETLIYNLHVSLPPDANEVATLTGAMPGQNYWLGGITSEAGMNPGDYLGVGWNFDSNFNIVGGSSAMFSCSHDSPFLYGGIWAIYSKPDVNPVPAPVTVFLFATGTFGLAVLRRNNIAS